MGMDFKVNFTTKIKINGKEYGSPEEVPEEYRGTVREALAAAKGGAAGKIVFNGTPYDSPDSMPAEVRLAYEEAMRKAGAQAAKDGTIVPAARQPGPRPEGSLTGRTLAVILALLAAVFLLRYFAPR